jgi:hypothetical protein
MKNRKERASGNNSDNNNHPAGRQAFHAANTKVRSSFHHRDWPVQIKIPVPHPFTFFVKGWESTILNLPAQKYKSRARIFSGTRPAGNLFEALNHSPARPCGAATTCAQARPGEANTHKITIENSVSRVKLPFFRSSHDNPFIL